MDMLKCIALILCLACAAMGSTIREKREDMFDFSGAFEGFEKGCGGKDADIGFIIDNSRSIWIYDFIRMKEFIRDFIHGFEIGPTRVRIAALTFGDVVYSDETFGFTRYQTEQEVQQGVMNIPYIAGSRTRTDLALEEFRTAVLPEARAHVPKIGIVLTDGVSTFPEMTAEEATILKSQQDVIMFAIGVGSAVAQDELEAIASRPEYVFRVTSFAALDEIKNYLGVTICTVQTTPAPTTPPPKDEPCGIEDPADIMFAYDSLDIGAGSGLDEVLRGIEVFVTQESIMHEDMHVGLVTNECPEINGFGLDEYSKDKTLIMDVFGKGMKRMKTDTSSLFSRLRTESFTVDNGGRPGVRRIAIVFLRHQPANTASILQEAELLKEEGVDVFVVAVGGEIDDQLLQSVASNPPDTHVFRTNDPNRVNRLGQAIAEKICEVA